MKAEETFVFASPGAPLRPQDGRTITEKEREELLEKLNEKCRIENEQSLKEKQKQKEKSDREVARLMAELNEMRKLLPQEEIDLQEVLREAEAEYKALPMHDFGAKEMSNEHDMSQKYGSRITNEIRRCQWDAEPIPKSLIADMHRIHEGKPPLVWKKERPVTRPIKKPQKTMVSQVKWDELEKRIDLSPKQHTNDHFSTVKAGFFNVARANKSLRNPTTLLLYLLQHRPWEGKRDKHDTYETWYLKRRLIVASVGEEKTRIDLGVSQKTVRNWINELHEIGVIRKVKDGQENVYVLGEIIDKKELFYYSGEIRWKKPGPLH